MAEDLGMHHGFAGVDKGWPGTTGSRRDDGQLRLVTNPAKTRLYLVQITIAPHTDGGMVAGRPATPAYISIPAISLGATTLRE